MTFRASKACGEVSGGDALENGDAEGGKGRAVWWRMVWRCCGERRVDEPMGFRPRVLMAVKARRYTVRSSE